MEMENTYGTSNELTKYLVIIPIYSSIYFKAVLSPTKFDLYTARR